MIGNSRYVKNATKPRLKFKLLRKKTEQYVTREERSRLQSPWDPFSKEPFSLILPLAHIFLVASGEPK